MSAPQKPSGSSARGLEPGHAADARPRGPEASGELDLLAGLWQVAPFARLPADAPPELSAYVQDVENPRRVYAIHRASRRHDFQHLVDKYVISSLYIPLQAPGRFKARPRRKKMG